MKLAESFEVRTTNLKTSCSTASLGKFCEIRLQSSCFCPSLPDLNTTQIHSTIVVFNSHSHLARSTPTYAYLVPLVLRTNFTLNPSSLLRRCSSTLSNDRRKLSLSLMSSTITFDMQLSTLSDVSQRNLEDLARLSLTTRLRS